MVHAESGTVCSPSSGGMASPYSDHSSGVPSPPTVVSEYNRPVDAHSTDGPHLVLTEQPQSKFRFRYKSEMVGTHGQLKAENADRNKPLFPTVKLMKWRDGPALIRLALYTGEDNFNQRTRHVHELGGKNCDKDTGMCEMVVDHTTDYTASFQNLGIIHIAKRDVKDIIKQRKKKRLIDEMSMRQPHRSIEEIRLSITPTDMKKIEEEADEISKSMDLNKVVLRFQAFHYDTSVDCYRALTRPVDSELVVNLKNASTGELKIVRMSECSAPCSGGTEVWMLVEKVKKSNIKIKFYELDSEFKEVWSAYGEFSESDVHHQYAIIFRTPPYRTSNLRQSVRVKVQLERPNDKDMSEPRDFTYYPSNRKRQSPFMETTKVEEEEDYSYGERSHKRHRQGSTEPLDLRSCELKLLNEKKECFSSKRQSVSSFDIPSSSNMQSSTRRKSYSAFHDINLFRSKHEERVDREQSHLKHLEEIIKKDIGDSSAQSYIPYSSHHQGKFSNSMSTDDLYTSPNFAPKRSSIKRNKSSSNIDQMRGYHSFELQACSRTLLVPALTSNSRSSSTQSLGITFQQQCCIGTTPPNLSIVPSSQYHSSETLADWIDARTDVKTYTELKPASSYFKDQASAGSSTYDQANAGSSNYGQFMDNGASAPKFTITTPEEENIHTTFWDL